MSVAVTLINVVFSKWLMLDASKCINKPFKMQDRLVDFNGTEYEKFTDMSSDSILQQTFKKQPLVRLWCSFKDHPQLTFAKGYQNNPLFQPHICVKATFSSYSSTNTTHCNRMSAKALRRTPLSSITADMKEMWKNVKQCHSAHCFENSDFFIKNVIM